MSVRATPRNQLQAVSGDHLNDLATVVEVASYLHCGRTRVFALLRSGDLPSVKVGKKRLIPGAAVTIYLDQLLAG